jgi:hypothetical protein
MAAAATMIAILRVTPISALLLVASTRGQKR